MWYKLLSPVFFKKDKSPHFKKANRSFFKERTLLFSKKWKERSAHFPLIKERQERKSKERNSEFPTLPSGSRGWVWFVKKWGVRSIVTQQQKLLRPNWDFSSYLSQKARRKLYLYSRICRRYNLLFVTINFRIYI